MFIFDGADEKDGDSADMVDASAANFRDNLEQRRTRRDAGRLAIAVEMLRAELFEHSHFEITIKYFYTVNVKSICTALYLLYMEHM